MSRNIITGIDVGTYYVKVIIANAKERNEKGLPKIIASGMAESKGLRHGYVTNVRDRVLHQAIFRVLYPVFDSHFIHDSYSCRDKKGTHLAVWRLGRFLQKSSHNHTSLVWTLKCDIKKFFDSIDPQTK
jgi:retron-type reverse transcriptase